jgi:hypothetical protein
MSNKRQRTVAEEEALLMGTFKEQAPTVMKISGNGNVGRAPRLIEKLSNNIKSFNISKASGKTDATTTVLKILKEEMPDKTLRSNVRTQAHNNSVFRLNIPTNISDGIQTLTDKEDLEGTIFREGLAATEDKFKGASDYQEKIINDIAKLERDRTQNLIRLKYLDELVKQKRYIVHGRFINECLDKYESNVLFNTSYNDTQFKQDEFEDDMMQLTNGLNSNSLRSSSYDNNNY